MSERTESKSGGTGARGSYHHGDLRRAIEVATLAVIDSDGLGAVSLRAIARRLGVSEAAPYHHFASKQELLATLAVEAYRGLHVRMLSALDEAGDDPFARLAGVGRSYVMYGLESRGRFRLMFGEHMVDLATYPGVFEAGRPTRVLLHEVVADCLGEGAGDGLMVEHSVWALLHGVALLISEDEIRFEDGVSEAVELTDGALDLMIRGIVSRER